METRRKAEVCKVSGWVRNLPDGNVEAVFEGERPFVEEVLAWCRMGPPASRVNQVTVSEQSVVGEREGFRIIH
jgi:acylphosphatase